MSTHHRVPPTKSRQVRAMQLFYELKQQFPTLPDHTITSKIDHHLQKNHPISKLLEVMREIVQQEESMGRAQTKLDSPTLDNIQGLQKEFTEEDSKIQNNDTVTNVNPKIVANGKIKRGLSDFKKKNEVCCDDDEQSGAIKNQTSETKSNSEKCEDNETNKQNKKPNEKEDIKFSVNNINESPNTGNNFFVIRKDKMDDQAAEKGNSKNENLVSEESCDKKELNDVGKSNLDESKKNCDIKPALAKRPNTLDFNSSKSKFKIQPSEKCTDVFTLLNSPNFNEKHPKALMSEKPPMSPLSAKRLFRNSPVIAKKETVSTPSQTTDTLLNIANLPIVTNKVSTPCQTTDTLINNCSSSAFSPSVNVSINCEMMQKPVMTSSNKDNKCSATLELTPTQPWLNGDQPTSPRSFTSVNLTLRPPGTSPQDPIDITSQNSSMTYSTSSFDPKRGLQSRLQITVGPSGAQNVTSMRTRPQSSYLPQLEKAAGEGEVLPARANSLTSLENISPEPPALLRQQARIDKMRIELRTGYARLVIMRKEVEDMKRIQRESEMRRVQQEVEKQLRMEVEHLKFQVKQLNTVEEILRNNTYIGGYGPERQLLGDPLHSIAETRPSRPAPAPPNLMRPVRSAPSAPTDTYLGTVSRRPSPFQEIEGPKWNCSMCTFLNHPSLEHCEECDMPRVLHVSAAPGDNIHIHVTPRLSRRMTHSWVL